MPEIRNVLSRYVPFGFNRWKQKPIRVCCPGGSVYFSIAHHSTVHVEIVPGVEAGRLSVVHQGPDRITLLIEHEETDGGDSEVLPEA